MSAYAELIEQFIDGSEEDKYRKKRNAENIERLQKTLKIRPDPYLKGSIADSRYNCAIISRPNECVKQFIRNIQKQLSDIVSNPECLWLSPSSFLHITIQEICFSRPESEVNEIVNRLLEFEDDLIAFSNHGPYLCCPQINLDENALALSFVSRDTSYLKFKKSVYDKLAEIGVPIQQRYYSPSAHITIVRFLKDLSSEDMKRLVHKVIELNETMEDISWKVSNSELVYGLTWYGEPQKHAR
ncbi:Piso0_004715 [Millerozyma farinosa CBS 7064]|uniref:Piso0_004715 protein n=1 Tax=Pichia sorbitophila (strain ATCC MYA-4447 / BCRC 22081 / CBS 7064 / NBRC 10061 / NRRL Y-12695) TaxID=559304 RepID=G8Y682_PICSO|nr:Piso0_004715 [Millerozyma farinosa CBS 7064]CCE85143.1 Piso0_004715 [Millerozyma farinosa CBS 7064]